MNRNLLILGAGQLGCTEKEIAERMNCFDKIDFLDDNSPQAIGALADYEQLSPSYRYAIAAIGDPCVRLAWIRRLEQANYQIPILIDPSAYVSPSARLMQGAVIAPNATVQADTTVAVGSIVFPGAVIRHNAVVEEGCLVDCNAVVLSTEVVPAQTIVPPLTCFATGGSKQ